MICLLSGPALAKAHSQSGATLPTSRLRPRGRITRVPLARPLRPGPAPDGRYYREPGSSAEPPGPDRLRHGSVPIPARTPGALGRSAPDARPGREHSPIRPPSLLATPAFPGRGESQTRTEYLGWPKGIESHLFGV